MDHGHNLRSCKTNPAHLRIPVSRTVRHKQSFIPRGAKLNLIPKRVKTTPVFEVILTPDWEQKELFFRSKNYPKFGVKLGVKVTPKRGYPVPKIFTPCLEL